MIQLDMFAAAPDKPKPRDGSHDYWCPHCGAMPGELCRSKGRASNLDNSDSDGDRIDKTLGEYDPPKLWDAWRRIEHACDVLSMET